uniref:Secreted protein n=1 Tax=Steinernema glaseri TaxID=37863 RepID=A0A1I8AU65_9BILA
MTVNNVSNITCVPTVLLLLAMKFLVCVFSLHTGFCVREGSERRGIRAVLQAPPNTRRATTPGRQQHHSARSERSMKVATARAESASPFPPSVTSPLS